MSGQHVAYVRVSTVDQNTARQLEGVQIDVTFTDKASGSSTARPQLTACLKHLRNGDTLHVHSIDRLARNLRDLLALIEDLLSRGVVIRFHKEALTFSGGGGDMQRLQLHILGAVAEFERSIIRSRQREGIEAAKKRGVYKGRKPKLTDEQAQEARARAASGEAKAAIAKALGISRQTLYTILARSA